MMTSYFNLLKYAATGIASPDMSYFDKMRASTLMGGVVQTLTGQTPLSFPSDGTPLISWSMKGNRSQTGTPTPSAPIQPEFVGARTGNLAPTATYSNDRTDTLPDFRPVLEMRKSGARVRARYYTAIGSAGTYSFAFTVADDIDEIRLIHNGSNRNLYPVDIFWSFALGDYVLSAAFTGANPSEVGGLALENIMLNSGSTALPYEPFGWAVKLTCGGQTVPVYLGQVSTVRKIRKLVLDGTENWIYRSGEPQNVYFLEFAGLVVVSNSGLCTHYQNQDFGSFSTLADKHVLNRLSPDSSKTYIAIRDSSFSLLSDFKAYLAAQYAAGTPVTVWYVLATPTTGIVNEPLAKIVDYADELHSEDSAVTIPTRKGSNTLTVDTPIQPSEMTITFKG